MAINLQDLRTAVQTYLDTKVTMSISTPTPDVPNTINPNEEFGFSVTATNATAALGGINLINVRYHLEVVNPAVAKLIVPGAGIATARSGSSSSSPALAPGSQVSEMFLFPAFALFPDSKSVLTPGDSDALSGLKGKAGAGPGFTTITCEILADPDLDFLFPKNENSGSALRVINVV